MSKIKNIEELKKIVLDLKSQHKKIVLTNGCFDLIHPGHIKILKTAKKTGDILIVALNSDISVKKIKGPFRPILNEKARAILLESMTAVDYIVYFDQKTPYNLIKIIKPDVLVKGGDWKKEEIIGTDIVKNVYRVKIKPGYSTSKIIEKIIRNG